MMLKSNLLLCVFALCTLLQYARCILELELREFIPPSSPSPPTLPVALAIAQDQVPRPIALVPGHTYYIMCRDTANLGGFDAPEVEAWRHNDEVVQQRSQGSFPPVGLPSVFASTDVSDASNEWTLVLQVFGGVAAGVYSCHGLQGEVLSLDIQQTALSVIAGIPVHSLTAGPLPNNGAISLSPFISPHSPSSTSVTWLFDGRAEFPPEVSVLGSEVVLRSPARGGMRGNYTCVVDIDGDMAEAVFVVHVYAPPNLVLSPSLRPTEVVLRGASLNVSCEDRTGFPLSGIAWSRDGVNLTSTVGRVAVSHTRTEELSRATLLVDQLEHSDTGTYRCYSENYLAFSQRTFTITSVLDVSTSLERSTWLTGETISFLVTISPATPTTEQLLQYHWLKDGRPLSLAGSNRLAVGTEVFNRDTLVIRLRISDALESDSGVYSFHVSSSLTTHIAQFEFVMVLGVAVTSIGHPTNSSFFIGLELELSCLVSLSSSFPPEILSDVEVVWNRDDGSMDLESAQHISVSDTMSVNGSYVSVMSFSPLGEGDGGEYVCSVCFLLNSDLSLVKNYTRTLRVDSTVFQLRLLDIGNCQNWVNTNAQSKVSTIITTLVSTINRLCPSCSLTPSHITSPAFTCFPESPGAVTFRAHLLGTETASSRDIISYLEAWLHTDGVIRIDVVLTSVDKSCSVEVSSMSVTECSSASEMSLVLVVAVSVGAGALVFTVVLVGVAVGVALCVSARRRKGAATLAGLKLDIDADDTPPKPTLSAVNPSLTGRPRPLDLEPNNSEPYYEDLDKYDTNSPPAVVGVTSYEKMSPVQIMPTITKTSAPDPRVPEYDYAAV